MSGVRRGANDLDQLIVIPEHNLSLFDSVLEDKHSP